MQIDRLRGVTGSVSIKAPCRAATTAAITLSGEQTINGFACITGDRVLVKDQNDAADNGIWVVDTGGWNRATDFDGAQDCVLGTVVPVYNGFGTYETWAVGVDDPQPGTTDILFELLASEGLAGSLANTSNTSLGDALVGVKLEAAGSVARTQHDKNEDHMSLFDFYSSAQKTAIRAGTPTDVTTAMALAFAEACSSGRALFINPGPHVTTTGHVLTKSFRLFGDNWRSHIYVDSAVGAGVDILKISPASSSDDDTTNYIFENFSIIPVSGTPGRHAIAIDITTRPVYASQFKGLRLYALGGRGFVTLPHATPLADGFFTSVIQDCYIANGIYLDKAGDTLRILNNTLTGANAGVYADLVFISVANKAHGLDIVGNNISSSGGCVHLKSAWGARLTQNVFESSAGNANNALIDLDGTDATNRPEGVLVYGNFLTVPSGVDGIRVNFNRMAQISMNDIAEPGGGGFCYRVTANATQTQILFNPTSSDSTFAAQITDAGTLTRAMRYGLGGRLEVQQDIQSTGFLGIGDGVTAPIAATGIARIFVDTADGDLKVIFADGTIKTIVVDT